MYRHNNATSSERRRHYGDSAPPRIGHEQSPGEPALGRAFQPNRFSTVRGAHSCYRWRRRTLRISQLCCFGFDGGRAINLASRIKTGSQHGVVFKHFHCSRAFPHAFTQLTCGAPGHLGCDLTLPEKNRSEPVCQQRESSTHSQISHKGPDFSSQVLCYFLFFPTKILPPHIVGIIEMEFPGRPTGTDPYVAVLARLDLLIVKLRLI